MLSLIVSSYQPDFFAAFEKNAAETVGIPYEIIKIDNPGLIGICEAYNKGAKAAKYEALLFVHEDVEFCTPNWGTRLLTHLENRQTGVLGLAGSKYVPNVPFAWWDNFEDTLMNIIQYHGTEFTKQYKLPEKTQCSVIDGVFLSCRKQVWEQFKFSEKIAGYHAYDIDFSVRVASFYQNFVLNDVSLKHFSHGKPDAAWWQEVMKARNYFERPLSQKINKNKELRYYELFRTRLQEFCPDQQKKLLLKYNDPRYIGYKASLKNLISIIGS